MGQNETNTKKQTKNPQKALGSSFFRLPFGSTAFTAKQGLGFRLPSREIQTSGEGGLKHPAGAGGWGRWGRDFFFLKGII